MIVLRPKLSAVSHLKIHVRNVADIFTRVSTFFQRRTNEKDVKRCGCPIKSCTNRYAELKTKCVLYGNSVQVSLTLYPRTGKSAQISNLICP